MRTSTKGLIAAGAAAVLLMGGAGTLAYWTDSEDIDAGSVTAGDLDLAAGTCDAAWVYAAGSAGAGTSVDLIVPGDVITKDCTFTVNASGDNLAATVDVPDTLTLTEAPTGTSFDATVSADYDLGGTALADGGTITSADDGETLTVTFEVDIPFGTDDAATTPVNANDMQNLEATLDTLTVTLTQTDPNP